MNTSKTILGLDPGSRNFGICLLEVTSKCRVKVLRNSIMESPVNDLVNFNDSSIEFLRELRDWMNPRPNGVIAERFQTRGHGGPLIEMVSCMLGLIRGVYWRTPIKLTTASSWKNKFNRRFEAKYGNLKEIYPECQAAPHQLDATLIGIYGLECGLGLDLDYDPYEIIGQVETTSMVPLKKRK